MFNQQQYQNLLTAADYIFQRQGLNEFGREFVERFVIDHDPRQGQSAYASAQRFFDYVAQLAQRTFGNGAVSDDQLIQLVYAYIKQLYVVWSGQRNFGNSGGGFGQGGFGFGRGNNQAFSFSNSPPPSTSHVMGDVVQPGGEVAQPPRQPTQAPSPSPMTFAPPVQQETIMSDTLSPNPLDDIPNDVGFSIVERSPNWGMKSPRDRSIIMTKRDEFKTADNRYVINMCSGLARNYTTDVMDVARDFFRVVPDQFLAELFIFRVFYNHVEELDIPTNDFIVVKDRFIAALTKDPDRPIYTTLMTILNGMLHGPRMALANYLVRHINRGLFLAFGMMDEPGYRISFNEIEDLDELLGPNFESRLLQVPDARNRVITIVNAAIRNALAGPSHVMFEEGDRSGIDAIRLSGAFPYSVEGVYPSKALIPTDDDDDIDEFFKRLRENLLTKKTFVRQTREVIFTNTFGQNIIPHVGKSPRKIEGPIASIFASFAMSYYIGSRSVHDAGGQDFDVSVIPHNYKDYVQNTQESEDIEVSRLIEMSQPFDVVDQMILAIQYKKSPMDFLMGLDIASVMERERDKSHAYLCKHKLETLKTTN